MRVEDGLRFCVRRYGERAVESPVAHIVEALAYFEDVSDDPFLPEDRRVIERYWRKRQPEIVKSIAKFGF